MNDEQPATPQPSAAEALANEILAIPNDTQATAMPMSRGYHMGWNRALREAAKLVAATPQQPAAASAGASQENETLRVDILLRAQDAIMGFAAIADEVAGQPPEWIKERIDAINRALPPLVVGLDSSRLALLVGWWFGERPDLNLRRALAPDELISMLDAALQSPPVATAQQSEAPAIAEWRKARGEYEAAVEAYNVAHRAALDKEEKQGFGFADLSKPFAVMTDASNKVHGLVRSALDALYATPPAHPAAGEATERADAEELRFYRRHGFPYVDQSAMFGDESLQGLYAIKLPLSWPNPEGEGTVAAVVVRAFTVEQLYAKAREHIDSLGPMPATERGAS